MVKGVDTKRTEIAVGTRTDFVAVAVSVKAYQYLFYDPKRQKNYVRSVHHSVLKLPLVRTLERRANQASAAIQSVQVVVAIAQTLVVTMVIIVAGIVADFGLFPQQMDGPICGQLPRLRLLHYQEGVAGMVP